MAPVVLGLDVGGANLKAATADRRAAAVPFPLWRQPDRLPAALADLVGRFPDADEFAVTMTGELCDCYETKRAGVSAILTAVQNIARCYPIRVWATDGKFKTVEEARRNPVAVAAANWHALATFAGGYVPRGTALLVDVGSTTADLIPILDGEPWAVGKTDTERLDAGELVYTGVRRTPLCALLAGHNVAAELFATTLDAYLLLGLIPEDPADRDTADGRPANRACAHARIARMVCGDAEEVSADRTEALAQAARDAQVGRLVAAARRLDPRFRPMQEGSLGTDRVAVLSGSGEFLAREVVRSFPRRRFTDVISLTDRLGPELAAVAPAYALAVLATERRP